MQHGIVKATTTEERRRVAPALPSSAAAAGTESQRRCGTNSACDNTLMFLFNFAAAAQPESARLVSVYEIDCARIYLRIRYPKYVLLMKEAYGDEAEVHFRVFSCYQVSQAIYVIRFLLASPYRL